MGNSMARLRRLESGVSVRVVAGMLSALLHVALFLLIVFSGGRQDGMDDGDTPIAQLLMLESRQADRRDGLDLPQLPPALPAPGLREQADLERIQPPTLLIPDVDVRPEAPDITPPAQAVAPTEPVPTPVDEPAPSTFVLAEPQTSALLKRVERLAEELAKASRARATWNQDGQQYSAELVLERAQHGVELDRVVADISAEASGRQLRTRVVLKRLPFSHFAQLIDRWDPMVQLHDDEINGRMHVNSRFNVLYDRQARPTMLGKVSTAAGGFNMQATSFRRDAEIFRGGVETRAGRIPLAEAAHPFKWAPLEADARVHELARDAHISFFADGSYWWRDRRSDETHYNDDPAEQPVYFIAADDATLYVQGVVAGRFLVYSPNRIVIEGNLTYAHDPRSDPDSSDFLGLVCDKDIQVAPPYVTGHGDIHIHAALFAKRRFVVTAIEHARSAKLLIFGSLTAGSVTASEPRYATKLEYDRRLEQLRPPGFPSTNRFKALEWDRRWTEVPERAAAGEL
jgi:hypothetical protein